MLDDKALGALRSLALLSDLTARGLPRVTSIGVALLLEGDEGAPSEVAELRHLRLGGCGGLRGGPVLASVARARATRRIATLELGHTSPTPEPAPAKPSASGGTSRTPTPSPAIVAAQAAQAAQATDEFNWEPPGSALAGGTRGPGGFEVADGFEGYEGASRALQRVCVACGELATLDLWGVPGAVTAESLYTLSARLRKTLTRLDVGGCGLRDVDALNPLRAMQPKLATISLAGSKLLGDGPTSCPIRCHSLFLSIPPFTLDPARPSPIPFACS